VRPAHTASPARTGSESALSVALDNGVDKTDSMRGEPAWPAQGTAVLTPLASSPLTAWRDRQHHSIQPWPAQLPCKRIRRRPHSARRQPQLLLEPRHNSGTLIASVACALMRGAWGTGSLPREAPTSSATGSATAGDRRARHREQLRLTNITLQARGRAGLCGHTRLHDRRGELPGPSPHYAGGSAHGLPWPG